VVLICGDEQIVRKFHLFFSCAGVATTFLGPNCQETILLDLRGVLEEAKQQIPEFLRRVQGETITTSMMQGNSAGCVYCGGLGHRILMCPKLEGERRKQMSMASGGGNQSEMTQGM
jgi:ATP-dependent RNA helicase DDX41